MSDDDRRRVEPPESVAGAPFWDASRASRLDLPWCARCGRPHWYPREVCPFCLCDELEWRPASGRGTVYALTVLPRAAQSVLADRVPYVVALVELDEGVRLMTNLVGDRALGAEVGDAVRVTWEPLSDGRHLPLFEVAEP